ncbi:MAG: hypothetical protein AB7O26_20525 [Planctomycetaceae bacterium]
MTADPAALNRSLDNLRSKVAGPLATTAGLAAAASAGTAVGTLCPKCGSTESWGMTSWCPRCGYYPAFGTCIDTGPRQDEPADAVSFVKVIPAWVWTLVGGIVAIFVLNIGATLLMSPRGFERYLWTITHLLVGTIAVITAHCLAFISGVAESGKITPFDIVLKPLEVWKPTMSRLPKKSWLVWCAAWGAWGIFCAAVLVGGVRYSTIFDDWGFEKSANVNLVQEIVKKARTEGEKGAESLEGAMNDFVGEGTPGEETEEEIAKWPHADCLIIGYQPDKEAGGFSSLLVASVVDNKLRYVGLVRGKDVPAESREQLYARMRSLVQKKPFVPTDLEAIWIKPELMCRVAYKDWTKSKEFIRPRFREMLRDFDPKKK